MQIQSRSRGRGGRSRKSGGFVRRLRLFVIFAGLLGLVWLIATSDLSLFRSSFAAATPPTFNRDRNAIWLAHTWTGDPHSTDEVNQLADTLAGRGFRYLFVHAGPFEADGLVPPDRYAYAQRFAASVKARHPQMVLLPWLGGLNLAGNGDLDLTSPKVRRNILTVARTMVDQGWDGVHLNIEPLPTGRSDFLTLLEELRAGLPSRTYLSVAGMRLWMLPVPLEPLPKLSDFVWDQAYLREVAVRVDQIAAMTYDSGLPERNLFIQYQRLETKSLVDTLALPKSAELLVGIPTYSDQRPNFNEEAENMATGLQGVIEGLRDVKSRDPFGGVAVYAHWTTSDAEWRTYEQMWLGRN